MKPNRRHNKIREKSELSV